MKKTRYSTAYLCVSLLLIVFLLFVPLGLSRGSQYISGLGCLMNTNTIFGGFFIWWLFGGVVAMIVGAVLNYCENSVVVKCVRIFLNLALLFAIYIIISVFEQHHFSNTAGAFILFVVAVFNLVLAIAMAIPRSKNKAVGE